jgi:hypothetical protein
MMMELTPRLIEHKIKARLRRLISRRAMFLIIFYL